MKFDWDKFKERNSKIAVHCKTEKEANKFCKEMDKHGMVWYNGKSYSENRWEDFKETTCYSSFRYYGRLVYYKRDDYLILEWSDYNTFTLSDLESGMTVELRDRERFIVVNETCYSDGKYITLSCYNDSLKSRLGVSYADIVKVYDTRNIAGSLNYILDNVEQCELLYSEESVLHNYTVKFSADSTFDKEKFIDDLSGKGAINIEMEEN